MISSFVKNSSRDSRSAIPDLKDFSVAPLSPTLYSWDPIVGKPVEVAPIGIGTQGSLSDLRIVGKSALPDGAFGSNGNIRSVEPDKWNLFAAKRLR